MSDAAQSAMNLNNFSHQRLIRFVKTGHEASAAEFESRSSLSSWPVDHDIDSGFSVKVLAGMTEG